MRRLGEAGSCIPVPISDVAPSPAPPLSDPEPKAEEQPARAASVNTTFAHVKPGEYSEIYLTLVAAPGARAEAVLSGPGVAGTARIIVNADDNGRAKLTWRINAYGPYTISGTAAAVPFADSVLVN